MSTLKHERLAFIGRLRTDPAFLSRHLRALSFAVLRATKNRLTIRLSSRHRGRKLWPDWLVFNALVVSPNIAAKPIAVTLPQYPGSPLTHSRHSICRPTELDANDDAENYFADHRWGFLLESRLENCADQRSNLDQCMRWIENHSNKTDKAWEPYSACERVANILIFLATVPVAMRVEEFPRQLSDFLNDSVNWIYRHLEYYGATETNNHIINNARALVMAGVAIGNRAAVSAGVRIFRNCLQGLIMSGGFLRERSSHYQLIVLN
jgi:hypothetical protein